MAAMEFSRPTPERLTPPNGASTGVRIIGVDPAGAGFERGGDAVGAGKVAGEDAGGEAEFGGVGAGDDLVLAVEIEHAHDGAEDLLARDAHACR